MLTTHAKLREQSREAGLVTDLSPDPDAIHILSEDGLRIRVGLRTGRHPVAVPFALHAELGNVDSDRNGPLTGFGVGYEQFEDLDGKRCAGQEPHHSKLAIGAHIK